MAEVILNRPPPPPPAAVDELGADDREIQEAGLTLREKLSQHAEKAACAGCHSRIDPLGFPLENFDGIGKWRESYGKFPVDASGELWGATYEDVVEFKRLLRANEEVFRRGFVRHLLTFALARDLEYFDEPAVDDLLEDWGEDGGLQDLLLAITTSETFTHVK